MSDSACGKVRTSVVPTAHRRYIPEKARSEEISGGEKSSLKYRVHHYDNPENQMFLFAPLRAIPTAPASKECVLLQAIE